MPEPIPSIEPNVPGRDGRPGVLLRVPYRSSLVAQLKESVPHSRRYWDDGVGAWWIDARELTRAAAIVLHHFSTFAELGHTGEEVVFVSREGATLRRRIPDAR